MPDPIHSHKQCMQFFNRSDEGNGQFITTKENIENHLVADLHYHWPKGVKKKDAAVASAVCASNNRPETGRTNYKKLYDDYREIRESALDKMEKICDDKSERDDINPNPPEPLTNERRYLVKDRLKTVGTDETL